MIYETCSVCQKQKTDGDAEEMNKELAAPMYCECVPPNPYWMLEQRYKNSRNSWICTKCDASVSPDEKVCPNCSYSKKLIDYNNPYGIDEINPYGIGIDPGNPFSSFTEEQLAIKIPKLHHCFIHDVDYYGKCLRCDVDYI